MTINHLGANSRGIDMAEDSDDKYLIHNDHIDLVADATQAKKKLFIGISSGNTYILNDEDFTEFFVFHFLPDTGSPTLDGDWVLRVPATQRFFGVINDTGFSMHVETAASPGNRVQLNDGARAALHSDGETVEEFLRDIYDLGFFAGDWNEGAIFGAFVAVRPFSLPASLPNSQAYAFTAPDESPSVDIQKNGSSVGTVSFTSGVNAGSFTLSAEQSFAIGDRLTLVNSTESPAEATMANISIVLRAVLT